MTVQSEEEACIGTPPTAVGRRSGRPQGAHRWKHCINYRFPPESSTQPRVGVFVSLPARFALPLCTAILAFFTMQKPGLHHAPSSGTVLSAPCSPLSPRTPGPGRRSELLGNAGNVAEDGDARHSERHAYRARLHPCSEGETC